MGSFPLLPPPEPKLIGIARLASQGQFLREGHRIEYFTLPAKSILNRCTGTRMPFTWTINPYRGCEFACKYCYARYTHEFMELRDGLDFERKIYVKDHAAELLRQELRHVKYGEDIAIGTATDPYSLQSANSRSHGAFWRAGEAHRARFRNRYQVRPGGAGYRRAAGDLPQEPPLCESHGNHAEN